MKSWRDDNKGTLIEKTQPHLAEVLDRLEVQSRDLAVQLAGMIQPGRGARPIRLDRSVVRMKDRVWQASWNLLRAAVGDTDFLSASGLDDILDGDPYTRAIEAERDALEARVTELEDQLQGRAA